MVDGGLMNPIPIAPTLHDITDLTIAVSLSGQAYKTKVKLPAPTPSPVRNKYHQMVVEFIDGLQRKTNGKPEDANFFEIISKSIDVMQNNIVRFMLAAYSPDILIEIPKDCCTIYEFDKAAKLIEIGRQQAEKAVQDYQESHQD